MAPQKIQRRQEDVVVTIAKRADPKHLNEYIKAYGGREVSDRVQALQLMSAIILKNGEKAFDHLAVIHPDRDFILGSMKKLSPEQFSNCDGCGGKCGGTAMSNADAEQVHPNKITSDETKSVNKPESGSFLEKNGMTVLFTIAAVAIVAIVVSNK